MLLDEGRPARRRSHFSGLAFCRRGVECLDANTVEMFDHFKVPDLISATVSREDEEAVLALQSSLEEQFQRAGEAHLRKRNRRRIADRLLRRPVKPYRLGGARWRITFHCDPEGRILPGEVEFAAAFGGPPQERTEGGATELCQPACPEDCATELAPAGTPPPLPTEEPFAEIVYADDHGDQSWRMVDEEIAVGRGGTGYYTDLLLHTGRDCSREHFRLRAVDKGIELFDSSLGGVSLEGRKLPHRQWTLLPPTAQIEAGKVKMEIQTLRRKAQ